MKTVFVVNPKAGKKNNIEKLVESIKEASKEIKADVKKAINDLEIMKQEFNFETTLDKLLNNRE